MCAFHRGSARELPYHVPCRTSRRGSGETVEPGNGLGEANPASEVFYKGVWPSHHLFVTFNQGAATAIVNVGRESTTKSASRQFE